FENRTSTSPIRVVLFRDKEAGHSSPANPSTGRGIDGLSGNWSGRGRSRLEVPQSAANDELSPSLAGSDAFHGWDWRGRFLPFRDERQPGREGDIALGANEEIEDPHPPFDGEAGAVVAGEHGVDGGSELQHLLRVEEYFGELLAAIP